MGFNADIDIAGGGAGSSLSVNGGKTDLSADYKGVGEQSGIFTGDGGLDLAAKGKTTLIGGAITTTDAAVAAGRNNYTSLGGIVTQDIENTTSYEGDAISVGLSVGKDKNPSMNGLGYGSDSDSDSSVTRAGITGIAGNKDITTDNRAEYAGILENSFDAGRVNKELGAQTQITQEFGKEAPKAVGDFASNRQLDLINEGKVDEADKWAEGGTYRVALHTLVGAIATGSVEGALASGTTAVSVPAVDKYLEKQGVDETTRDALLLGLSTAAGALVGGDTASTATSFSQTQNNYLNHIQLQQWINDLKKAKGNGRRIEEINNFYKNLDKKQQTAFANDCETNYNYQKCGEHVKNYYAGSGQYKGNTLFDPKLYSQIENLGGLGRGSLRTGVTFNNDQFLSRYSRWESDASYRQDGILGLIAQGAIGVGGSRIVKGATSKASNSTSSSSMLGANGTQTSSKTVWKEKGSKARIDVENPAPGERPGQVHYQDANNAKYYYNPADGKLYTGKISDGLVAPKSIQKLLKNDDFKNGINKGLKYLGE
ncbi:hypothetical protein ACTXGK_07600 [Psychrobacter sp. T6-5]|uniref:hypothetical protein n=1 Tax=Psychrobacter sp. T6-5 TaxID=3457451 RepID=UPI003FCFFA23